MMSRTKPVHDPAAPASPERLELAETADATSGPISIAVGGASQPASLPADRIVAGRYALGGHIGSGGFGSVYEAHDLVCDRVVAIKLLGAQSERQLRRFRYETTSMRLLQVPGVVRLYDDGADRGEAFIVMERLEGSFFPSGSQPTPWTQLARPALSLLEAVARVHALGVIHRDLKPSNVIVDRNGNATVLDFGVSAFTGIVRRDGEVVGTPIYLAPEQATGEKIDARADLYAIGVMLFEALSGTLPHEGATSNELIRAKVDKRAALLRTVAPDVSEDIAELVDWMLEPRPADRPTALEVIDAPQGRTDDDPIGRRVEALAVDGELDAARLRSVFAGPDVFLHIPSDAAALAISRAGVGATSVAHELGGWIRAGLARAEGDSIAVDRTALHRIAALPVGNRTRRPRRSATTEERDIVAWVALSGPTVSVETLARAIGVGETDLRAQIDQLVAADLVQNTPAGLMADAFAAVSVWSQTRMRQAHESLFAAIAPGDPNRLRQALLAADPSRIVSELNAFVTAAIRDGRLESARALLGEASRVVRQEGDTAAYERVMVAFAEIAMSEATLPAYDHLLIELGLARVVTPLLDRLTRLATAGRLGEERDHARAIALLDSAGEFESDILELRRRASRVRVAMIEGADHAAALEQARRWAESAPPPAMAHLRAWEGRVHYRAGRYAEAARAFLWAASAMESAGSRLLERLNAASAMLETYSDFDELVALAAEIRKEGQRLRNPLAEARATWIERAARYRRGDVLAPCRSTVEGAVAIGLNWQASLLIGQEAAIAWRAGDPGARDLFMQASELAARANNTMMRQILRLAAAIADGGGAGSVAPLTSAIEMAERDSTPPGVRAQLGMLVWQLDVAMRPRAADLVLAGAAALPAHMHAYRREIFSIDECLHTIGAR